MSNSPPRGMALLTNIAATAILIGAGLVIYSKSSPMANSSARSSQSSSANAPSATDHWNTALSSAAAESRAKHKPLAILFADDQDDVAPLPASFGSFKDKVVFVRLAPPTGDNGNISTTLYAEKLGVTETPQLVLVDDTGRGIARALLIREIDATPAVLTPMLNILQNRDRMFERAASLTGLARAQALDGALSAVADFRTGYLPELREISALDKDNSIGLRQKYLPDLAALELDNVIQQQVYPLIDHNDFKAAAARLDELILQWGPDSKKLDLLYAFKGQVLSSSGDAKNAVTAFDAALRYAPEGSEAAARVQTAKAQLLEKESVKVQ